MEIKVNLPTSWNELTVENQLKCYGIIMGQSRLFEPQEEVPAKRMLLFQIISGITDQQIEAWRSDCIQADEEDGETVFLNELNTALESCDFLFDITETEDDDTDIRKEYAISLSLTKCPWPKLDRPAKKNGKVRSYYAAADELSNISFLELCVSFHLFEQYLKDHDEDILNELLAVIYRSPKPRTRENKYAGYHGDKRQPYLNHEAMVPKRKKQMATLPDEVKRLLAFWFASCRQHIINQYPDLFDNTGGGSGSKYGWAATLMAMAGSLPNLDLVSSTPAEDALTYLDYLNEQARKAKLDAAFKQH